MVKFKINKGIYHGLSKRIRDQLDASGFKPLECDLQIPRVSKWADMSEFNLNDLEVGEAYSIFGFANIFALQRLCTNTKKKTGKVFTVHTGECVVLRIA